MPAAGQKQHDSARLKAVFIEVITLDQTDRDARLASLCTDDATFERACRALLFAHDSADRSGFLAEAQRTLPTAPIAPHAAELSPGTPIDPPDHDLLRPIAQGGFGQVWLARNRHTDRLCAIKVIDRYPEAELEGVRRLQHCVKGHPHLMPIDHVGLADGRLFCIMPLADNASAAAQVTTPHDYAPLSLDVWVRRNGLLPEPAAAALGCDIALALGALHSSGLVHGDVKPQNILRVEGRWVLADYSLVGSADSPSARGRSSGYTPDRGAGAPAGDLFSLGQVLQFLRTAKHPSPGTDPVPGAPTTRPWRELVQSLTHADPDARTTARDAARALMRLQARPRRRAVAAALMTLVLAVVVVVIARPPATGTGRMFAQLYRDQGDERDERVIDIGRVLAQPGSLQPGDFLKFDLAFDQRTRAFLIVVTPDGQQTLCHPASVSTPPRAQGHIVYPKDLDLFHQLSEGIGNYAFVLVAARSHLPSFDAWSTRPTAPPASMWTHALRDEMLDAPILLRAVDGVCAPHETTRGLAQRTPTDSPLRELLASISRSPGVAWVDALVVPVAECSPQTP